MKFRYFLIIIWLILALTITGCTDRSVEAKEWNKKGMTLMNQMRFEEALEAFDTAIGFNQTYAEAWNNKGALLYQMERYEEALAALDKAIQFDPNRLGAWYSKGYTLRKLGRDLEANAVLEKARTLSFK